MGNGKKEADEMEMLLMALVMSLLVGVISAIAFSAAAAPAEPTPSHPAHVPARPATSIPQFFVDDVAVAAGNRQVPIEVLLLQIERHVRLEQAAAEAFHAFPNSESLHSPTTSPLIH